MPLNISSIKMLRLFTAPEEDSSDPYGGYGTSEVAPALLTEDLEFDEGFQVRIVDVSVHAG